MEEVSILGLLHHNLNTCTGFLQGFIAKLLEVVDNIFLLSFFLWQGISHATLMIEIELTIQQGCIRLLEWRLLPALLLTVSISLETCFGFYTCF